jgi:NADPH:quinone reductase-like Zn-dependent oxidoreductase
VIRHGRPGTFRVHEAVPAPLEADELTPMPARFSFEQAAVLPVAAGTAYSALVQIGLRPGERLIVHGASGGVGLATVQLARLLGAGEIIGTASAAHHDLVRSFGVHPVEYGEALGQRLAPFGRPDAFVDCVGGPEAADAAIGLVGEARRRVTIVGNSDAHARGLPLLEHVPQELAATLRLIADSPFELPVRSRYRLADAAAALVRSQQGHIGGKLILVPGGEPPSVVP